jgi:transposase InsO family protein
MKIWLSSRRYREQTGDMPKSTLARKAKRGEVTTRESPIKSRGREYLLETVEAGDAGASLCTDGSSLKKNLHNALALAGAQGELLDAQMPIHFTSEQQARAKEGAKLLAPLIAFSEGRLPAVRLENGREIRSQTGVIKWLASQGHASETKLRRLWKRSEEGKNLDGLARPPRKDRNRSRVSEKYPLLPGFVVKKWTETENISFVEDAVEREWGGPLLPYGKNLKPPRYGAIHRIIESIPKAVRDCATLPKQKWEASHAPYIVTGRGQYTRPLQVWVSDHRLYDVLLDNDCFPYAPAHAAIRLWETCIQDMRTRVIVGSVWNVTPSWRTIASALHQGISRFGQPEIFYVDNGRDFRKIGAGAERGSLLAETTVLELDEDGRVPLSSETQGLLARLGVKVSYCIPRHPQSKQIEAFFSYVAKRFDRIFFRRGYTGSKPSLRSDFCAEAEKEHKKFVAGKCQTTPLVGAKQFIALHAQWLKEYNETHAHSGCGMHGKTPMMVMDELLPVAQRQIPDMLALAPLFWDVQPRKVSNCKIQINNATYSAAPDDADGQGNMYLANETTIAVHLDPNDLAYALAFEDAPNGRLLARLVSDELAAQAPITAEHVGAKARERAGLRKASMKAMAALTDGVPAEIELMEARATGTDGAGAASAVSYPSPRRLIAAQPAIVSDAVKLDRGIFDKIELED